MCVCGSPLTTQGPNKEKKRGSLPLLTKHQFDRDRELSLFLISRSVWNIFDILIACRNRRRVRISLLLL